MLAADRRRLFVFFFSSRRRHTRCALVTGVQTCALPIFPRESVPKVYDALKVQDTAVTLEVQQQLGDGVVRTIALGSTDGLKRNLVAEYTGRAVSVPVGSATLGRIMNVLGEPIAEVVPIGAKDHWEIPSTAPR